jgi:hypothetical protein
MCMQVRFGTRLWAGPVWSPGSPGSLLFSLRVAGFLGCCSHRMKGRRNLSHFS